MVIGWNALFVVGAFVGKTTSCSRDSLPWLAISLCGLGMALAASRGHRHEAIRRWSLLIPVLTAAFCWGLAHNAPPPTGHLRDAVVIPLWPPPNQGRLLVTADAKTYEVSGRSPPSTRGHVTCGGRSLWGTCRGSFRATWATGASRPLGPLDSFTARLRDMVQAQRARVESPRRWWIDALLLGDKRGMPRPIVAQGKATGLYHLIVVSGSHVTLLAALLALSLRGPFQTAYARRWIGPQAWLHIDTGLRLATSGCVLAFGAVIEFAPPVQRACLLFVIWNLVPVLFGERRPWRLMALTLACQSLLFPTGFLSESNLLSWAAFVCVAVPLSSRSASAAARFRHLLTLQALLGVMCGAVIGSLSVAGLVLNPLVVPVFGVIVYPAVWAFLGAPLLPLWLSDVLLRPADAFGTFLLGTKPLFDRWPWLCQDTTSPPVRAALAAGSVLGILLLCRRLLSVPIVAQWSDITESRRRTEGAAHEQSSTLAGTPRPDR